MAISQISGGALRGALAPLEPGPAQGGEDFAGTIARVIDEANRDQHHASGAIRQLLVDGTGTIHDAMIAVNRADSSFRLLMEMRNRLIEGVNQLLETKL
jgi:flagellar hook-basal body complex protein FliE